MGGVCPGRTGRTRILRSQSLTSRTAYLSLKACFSGVCRGQVGRKISSPSRVTTWMVLDARVLHPAAKQDFLMLIMRNFPLRRPLGMVFLRGLRSLLAVAIGAGESDVVVGGGSRPGRGG